MPLNLVRILNWTFRTAELREARGSLAKSEENRKRAVLQVRLLVEVARRVVEPTEALPAGSRPAVLMALYREAAHWMLAAMDGGSSSPASLDLLWSATPPEKLLEAADGDEKTVEIVRAALVGYSSGRALDSTDEEADRVGGFVESLLWEFDAPRRRVNRVQWQRWSRIALVAGIVVLVCIGVRRMTLGPDLAAGMPLRTSSSFPECRPNDCADLAFHTLMEENPWVVIDLAKVQAIHRVDVDNRSDCCAERALPLIMETSLDDKQWVQVARRDSEFSTWTASFSPVRARYVRLRVPRTTVLHLHRIAIR